MNPQILPLPLFLITSLPCRGLFSTCGDCGSAVWCGVRSSYFKCLHLLPSTGSGLRGFSSCSSGLPKGAESVVVVHELRCPACGIFSDLGSKPCLLPGRQNSYPLDLRGSSWKWLKTSWTCYQIQILKFLDVCYPSHKTDISWPTYLVFITFYSWVHGPGPAILWTL